MLNDVLGMPDLDLAGLSDVEVQNLLGELGRLPVPQKANAFRRIMASRRKPNPTASHAVASDNTSRGELLKRLDLLPPDIVERIKRRELQLSDARLMVTKAVGTLSQVKLFRDNDVKAVGVAMINGAKLAKDNWMIVTGIQVLSGVDASVTACDYGTPVALIRNGQFEFKVDKKNLLPDTHSECFAHGRTDVEKGTFILHNPKIIEPQKDIEMNFEFAGALAANTNLKVVLIGSGVIPY
jgi:hypothetical protein